MWIFFVDDGWELLYMNSLSLVMFLVWAIFSFSLSLFFWHTLWVCGTPSLGMHLFSFFDMPCGHVAYLLWVCIFYFFLYSPYIMMITLERDKHGTTWSFICGWMDVLAIFQVLEYSMWVVVYVILIIGVWSDSHKGSQQFDKAQWEDKLHM